MSEIKAFLLALPQWQLWLIGGMVSEVVLQIIKRYVWQPPEYEKAKKLLAAALVSFVLALGSNVAGGADFAAAWLGMFLAAIGYHETTDKLGLKQLWANIV